MMTEIVNRITSMSAFDKGRCLVVLGFAIGLKSLWMSISHIGDTSFLLIDSFDKGSTHARYHVFREVFADISAMVVVLMVLFVPAMERSPTTWLISVILVLGYYLPFWVGAPWMPELAAPHWRAELVHIAMALPVIWGMWLVRREFFQFSQD